MAAGAGLAAARQYGAALVVDPRPWAYGSLAAVFAAYPHLGPVLPALGYRPEQVADLARTIAAVPCDLVLTATPIDLSALIGLSRPVQRVTYAIGEEEGNQLRRHFAEFLDHHGFLTPVGNRVG
jgi:predicted GTPase